MLGAAFDADDCSFLVKQFRVPRRRPADRFREDGGHAVVGDAVQCLVPVVVDGQTQPRNGGSAVISSTGQPFPPATCGGSDHRCALFSGFDGSRQIGASWTSGTRTAAAEKASANSEALKETTDVPSACLDFDRVEFGDAFARHKGDLQRSAQGIIRVLNRAADRRHLARPAGLGEDVEILGQRRVTRSHRNTLSPAAVAVVSAAPMVIVYLPAGNVAMVTVKFGPLTSSRKLAA